jgi:DNA-binding XRE family transcriptional regulator
MAGRKSWEDVRAQAAGEDPDFEEGVAVERRRRELVQGLHGLRNARGSLQSDLADVLEMTQANVSRIEREDNVRLGTLARYVEGLGGRLEIHAIFDDVDMVIAPARLD